MKKSWICLLGLIISLFLIKFIFAIRINEVELNPDGTDSRNEWIELYSESKINITNWEIRSNNGRSMIFNASFSGYYILNTSTNLLTNSNNKLYLYNNSEMVFETEILNDKDNDGNTWQYCDGKWNFEYMTRGSENYCVIENNSQQEDYNQDNESTSLADRKINLKIEWNSKDIINGEEFEILVSVYNLDKSKNYDIKIWIETEDNAIISESYDEKEDEWRYGGYYVNNFFEEVSNKTKEIILKIKENKKQFLGDAKIKARIREHGKSYIKDADIEKDIKILKQENSKQESESFNKSEENKTSVNSLAPIKISSGGVIRLGSSKIKTEDIKTQKNILYESKTELIKKYSVFGFGILCVLLSILLIFDKLN